MALPRKVSPGDRLLAAEWNAILDAIRQGMIQGGRGIQVTQTARGVSLSLNLEELAELFPVIGRVVSVSGSGDALAGYTYGVRAIGRPDLADLSGITPINRPADVDGTPAEVGALAVIYRLPQPANPGGLESRVWIEGETWTLEDCVEPAVVLAVSSALLGVAADAIVTDADGAPILNADREVIGDARASALLRRFGELIVAGADGRWIVDADGQVVLSEPAALSADVAGARVLAALLIADADGEPIADADGNLALEAAA